MHRLDRYCSRTGSFRLDPLRDTYPDTDGDSCLSDPEPDCHRVHEHGHEYSDIYAYTHHYFDEHAILDSLCTCFVYTLAYTDSLSNTNHHPFTHANLDAESDDDTFEHTHTDGDAFSITYSISINDGYPPFSEVTDLCFRSFGL